MAVDGRTKEGRKRKHEIEMEIWNEYCRAEAKVVRTANDKYLQEHSFQREQFDNEVKDIDIALEKLNRKRNEIKQKYDTMRDKAYEAYRAECDALRKQAGWVDKTYDEVVAEGLKKMKVR